MYPVRKPPHIPAAARRHYAQVLSLPLTDPWHALLRSLYRMWFHCDNMDWDGRDLSWKPSGELANYFIKNPELPKTVIRLSDLFYVLMGIIPPLLEVVARVDSKERIDPLSSNVDTRMLRLFINEGLLAAQRSHSVLSQGLCETLASSIDALEQVRGG